MEEGNFIQRPNIDTGTGHTEVHSKPQHSSNGVSFIVVLGHDFAQQLELPQGLLSTFNSYISHRVIIESTMTKMCWKIELKDRDGRLYFRDGWSEFVAAHSLEIGNFLVFECEECPIFHVKFYHNNGCEKSPSLCSKVGVHNQIGETRTDEDGESEAFNEEQKVRKKTDVMTTRRLTLRRYKKQNGGNRKSAGVHSKTRGTKVSICGSNVCFSITLHKRKKHQFYQVTIPRSISSQKKLSSKQKIELQDEKGRCWPVTITHPGDGRVIFCRGWKDFLHGNEVSPGDTLKFEFISDDLLQVHVMKGLKVAHHHQERRNQAEASGSQNVNYEFDELVTRPTYCKAVDASAVTVAKKVYCELTSSSFSIVWWSNTSGGFLYIPKEIVMTQNLEDKDSIVLRDPERKCWPLEVSHKPDGCTVLTKGWPDFWQGLGITAGDTLMFKFMTEYLIQVTIDKSKPRDHVTK